MGLVQNRVSGVGKPDAKCDVGAMCRCCSFDLLLDDGAPQPV